MYIEELKKKLTRGSIASFAVTVLGTGIAFCLHLILARIMGAEQYGIYAYVLAWLSILILISVMGWDTTLVRYIAEFHGKQAWAESKGLQKFSKLLVFTAAITIMLTVIYFADLFRNRVGDDLADTFQIGSLAIPIVALLLLNQAILRAMKLVALAGIPRNVVQPTLLSILVLAIHLTSNHEITGYRVMTLDVVSASIALILAIALARKHQPEGISGATPRYKKSEWTAVSLPLFLISGMYLLLSQTDMVMIGILLNPEQAGVYSISSRLSTLIAFGILSVNSITAPIISELYHSGKHQGLQHMVNLAAKGILIFSIPATLCLILFGEEILSLFGKEFEAGYSPLVILCISQFINSITGSVGLLLTMTGHERDAAHIIGTAAVLNIILNAFLIPAYGIQGAATATAISTVFWNFIMWFRVQKRMNINPSIVPIRLYRQ